MSAIVTEKFRMHNAKQFKESFNESGTTANPELDTNYYIFIGKNNSYIDGDNYDVSNSVSDSVPPVPQDDVTRESYNWDAMVAAKRITESDVTFVAPRRNWVNGTIYDMYEHDIRPASGIDATGNPTASGATSLWASNYFFVTSEYKVYKVLDNAGGTAYSGAEPTSTGTTPFAIGGYYLKYMFTLSINQIDKFLTSAFIPVTTDTTVSNAAIDGAIEVLRITGGSNYTDGTYYSAINGDGSGGIVKIVVASNTIQAFESGGSGSDIQAAGSGYTYGFVDLTNVFSDTALSSSVNIGSGSGGTGGKVEPIIPPRGGHGKDAVDELAAHFVMVNAKLTQSEGDDITTANDFRQLGIVSDPFNYGTTTVSTATTRRQTYAVKLAGSPSIEYIPDEQITQTTTGAVGRIVEWDTTNNIIYYVQEKHPTYGTSNASGTVNKYVAFNGANQITGANSNAVATPSSTASEDVRLAGGNILTFTNGYASPELQPDSGSILYIENRRPISRAADQTEDVKITIEF